MDDSRPLTDEEVNTFVRLLIIAGAGTTYKAYGNLMFLLLSHPEQLAAVRDDRSLVPLAIDESLRIEQPLGVGAARRECRHHRRRRRRRRGLPGRGEHRRCESRPCAVGERARDVRHLPRPSRSSLSFGFGIHRCLGIHLARAELNVLLNRTLDLLPNLRFDPDAPRPHITGLTFRMPTAVPAVWDVDGG